MVSKLNWKLVVLYLLTSLGFGTTAIACLWDYDTLAMERARFPEAQEMIAGYYARHSDAYYRWRIEDRLKKTVAKRNPIDYDDIAVAYDKLGEHDKAIEIIQQKIDRWPIEIQYESEANLGTFLIHAGRYEEGLTHIEKAIEINPDAHFGREIYQKKLVEYLLRRKQQNVTIPLRNVDDPQILMDFHDFVFVVDQENQPGDIEKAVKGILGMMRFGNHDSPILLEALADLIFEQHHSSGTKMLAARAYLKASYILSDGNESAAAQYRKFAEKAIRLQEGRTIQEIEIEFKQEIAQGDQLIQQIADDEQRWIEEGRNLDEEFAVKYLNLPPMQINKADYIPITYNRVQRTIDRNPQWMLSAVAVLSMILFLLYLHRKINKNSDPQQPQPLR